MMTLIIIILLFALLGGGYRAGVEPLYLGSGMGTVLIVVLVLYLLGVL